MARVMANKDPYSSAGSLRSINFSIAQDFTEVHYIKIRKSISEITRKSGQIRSFVQQKQGMLLLHGTLKCMYVKINLRNRSIYEEEQFRSLTEGNPS